MTLRRTVTCLVAATTVAGCAGGRAEVVPTSPAADERPAAPPPGSAITVRLALSPASVRVGDTVRVDAAAVGPDGAPLPRVDLEVRAPRRLLAVIDGGRALVALREGSGVVTARVRADGAPADGDDAPASADVRVTPAPLVRFDLAAPSTMYAGSRVRVAVMAETAFGARDRPPEIAWRSSEPSVLRVTPAGGLEAVAPGRARVEATAEGERAAIDVRVIENPVHRVDLSPGSADARVGEVVHLSPRRFDASGREVQDVPVQWSVAAVDDARAGSAEIDPDGAFVANRPGTYRVVAAVGPHAAAAVIRASARRPPGTVRVVAHRGTADGPAPTGHLRVFEGVDGRDRAYAGAPGASTLHVWDLADPDDPRLADSVALAGGRVSDVEIDERATLAVVSSVGAPDRRPGITLLDILDPAVPRVVTHVTGELSGGVRDAWIEGPVVYAAHESDGDLHVLDVSDPAAPRHAGRWGLEAAGRSLHGVVVKDGFAYLGYGYDGLVILDVGAGIAGGTATDPRLVSRFTGAGVASRAVRYRDWVFVAHEVDACASCAGAPRGFVSVLDVTDVATPREVARYELPGAGAHDLRAEDDLLYVAGGEAGVRVLDISGELRGDLGEQGRELARFATGAADARVPNLPAARGTQPFEGRLYVGDDNSGLWILELEGAAE